MQRARPRQGTTAPESEFSLPPIRTPGETWANYFARVPDAVAPGTEALLASERRKVGQGISKDMRESSLGAAEALGRQRRIDEEVQADLPRHKEEQRARRRAGRELGEGRPVLLVGRSVSSSKRAAAVVVLDAVRAGPAQELPHVRVVALLEAAQRLGSSLRAVLQPLHRGRNVGLLPGVCGCVGRGREEEAGC